MDMLLSVYPKYVKSMMSGEKLVEFRKHFQPTEPVKRIFVYATFPVKKICGWFMPEDVRTMPLEQLWEETQGISCMDRKSFDAYFMGCETGTGIFFRGYVPVPPLDLEELGLYPTQTCTRLTPEQSALADVLFVRAAKGPRPDWDKIFRTPKRVQARRR